MIRRITLLLSLLLGLSLYVQGQTIRYVDPSAMGASTGLNWTDAETSLSGVTPVRNEIIYVCDGTIASGTTTLNTAASGTQTIEIRHATDSDHGIATGWSNGMCDGQSDFGPMVFSSAYWIFNGATRTNLSSGHGIKITHAGATAKGIRIQANNITIDYVETQGGGDDGDGSGNDSWYCAGNYTGQYIGHSYFHDVGRIHLLSTDCDGTTIEYSYFYHNESSAGEHSELWSIWNTDDIVFRYNVSNAIEGTGAITKVAGGATPDGGEIYGNIFANYTGIGNGMITTGTSGYAWTNGIVCNNVFYNVGGSQAGVNIYSGGSGWQVYNNIWYSNGATNISISGTHDYNYFSDNTDSTLPSEANIQDTTGDPFVDTSTLDFHLSGATDAGSTGSPCSSYPTDPDGLARGDDGTWDRGAFEFVSGAPDVTLPVVTSPVAHSPVFGGVIQ